jgi:hypothetical protein
MTLNEKLEFRSASREVQMAFLGVPEKVLLKARTKLYKWTDYPLVGPFGITPWWSYFQQTRLPSGFIAEGFGSTENFARRLGVHHREYQRVRGAVSEKFDNNMQLLLLIELTVDAWGFAGRTSGQPEFKDPKLANVYLIGGKGQLWIPGLKASDVIRIPAEG